MRLASISIGLLTAVAPALALTTAVVPEPSTLSLLALGAAAGGVLLWRKRRGSKS